ncbi:MAG: carbohydrate ABC transporter permease [Spirochaeta sp.]
MSNMTINGGPILEFLSKPKVRIVTSILIIIALGVVFTTSVEFMRQQDAPRFLLAAVSLIVGVLGIWLLYLSVDNLVDTLPTRPRDIIRPYVFVIPAILVLAVYLLYPGVRTIWVSFFAYFRGGGGPEPGTFGFQNYMSLFTDKKILIALRNNLLWLILVPLFSVSIGLIIAVLVDRIKWEKYAKSLIFLPMAISFVGASIIWRFIYYRAPYGEQIGLLNGIRVNLLGLEPIGFLRMQPWNNLFLIVIMIWLQTGFAMVILSSAVKGVPRSLLEAARIDGAGELRVFFQVIIPYIGGTILTITTTITILVLKIFDVVFVMTSGNYDTNVIANVMYQQMFVQGNFGRGSAAAVLLFIGVLPIMIYNIRNLERR